MEAEKEDQKYFHVENLAKNIWTTIIGCILMGVSAFTYMIQWFMVLPVNPPEWWQLCIIFVAGFALLFMRDKVITYIDIFTKKKIDNTK